MEPARDLGGGERGAAGVVKGDEEGRRGGCCEGGGGVGAREGVLLSVSFSRGVGGLAGRGGGGCFSVFEGVG